jgi:DNA-binding protein YbaB
MEDVAHLITTIAAQLERAAGLSAVAEELSAEIATLRGTGSSDDDEATVTVDQGLVLDVVLAEEAVVDADGESVSGWVLAATSRAIEDLQRQAAPLRAAMLQPDLPPMRTDLSERIDELYDLIERAEAATRSTETTTTTNEESER